VRTLFSLIKQPVYPVAFLRAQALFIPSTRISLVFSQELLTLSQNSWFIFSPLDQLDLPSRDTLIFLRVSAVGLILFTFGLVCPSGLDLQKSKCHRFMMAIPPTLWHQGHSIFCLLATLEIGPIRFACSLRRNSYVRDVTL
jgi:hypothetical protein